MLHRILKSDLKLSMASARWVPRLLSIGDCEHNPASYNCNNLNDVRRWFRHTVAKISAQTYYLIFFLSNLHGNSEIMENSQVKFNCNTPYSFLVIYKVYDFLGQPSYNMKNN